MKAEIEKLRERVAAAERDVTRLRREETEQIAYAARNKESMAPGYWEDRRRAEERLRATRAALSALQETAND
jgi:hypothetical protein